MDLGLAKRILENLPGNGAEGKHAHPLQELLQADLLLWDPCFSHYPQKNGQDPGIWHKLFTDKNGTSAH